MKFKEITYNNMELKRINFKRVDNILKNYSKHLGLTIYVAPINMRIDNTSYWNSPFEIEIDNYNDYYDYINQINEIRYYNCVEELGKYLKFYIKKVSDK